MFDNVNDGIPHIAYIGLIIPLAGMSIGAFAIWTEHRRKEKALDLLKVYAEKGEEPPEVVLRSLANATSPGNPKEDDGTASTAWRKFAFFIVMALGFGGAALWTHSWGSTGWPFTMGFGITAFVMAAMAASMLARALTMPKNAG